MELTTLSLADLEALENNVMLKYHDAFNKTVAGDTSLIPARDLLETKLTQIRSEINNRVDNFLNA